MATRAEGCADPFPANRRSFSIDPRPQSPDHLGGPRWSGTPNPKPPHSTPPNQSRRITDGHKTPPHDPHQCPYRALSRMKRHSPGPEPVSCATQARTFARDVLLEQPNPNTPNPKLQQTKTQSLAAGPFSLVRTTSEPASCRALARVCNDTCLCDDQWSSALHGETDGGTSG